MNFRRRPASATRGQRCVQRTSEAPNITGESPTLPICANKKANAKPFAFVVAVLFDRRDSIVTDRRYRLELVQKTIAGQEAYFRQNDPHPDPLPSDGRGNSQISFA